MTENALPPTRVVEFLKFPPVQSQPLRVCTCTRGSLMADNCAEREGRINKWPARTSFAFYSSDSASVSRVFTASTLFHNYPRDYYLTSFGVCQQWFSLSPFWLTRRVNNQLIFQYRIVQFADLFNSQTKSHSTLFAGAKNIFMDFGGFHESYEYDQC